MRLIGGAGANRAMEAELKRLAARALGGRLDRPERVDPQTLRYPFDPRLAWLAVRYARAPSRVVWDLVEIHADRLEPLHADLVEALGATRPPWMVDGAGFSVEVRRSDAFAAGPLQIRGAVKNALLDAARRHGQRLLLDPEQPRLSFRVEADRDRVRLGLDLGGRSLHRRGQRTLVGEASLKETLAAQVLLLARWDPRSEALVDPMAGAGTFLLEAAGAAVGAPTWREPPPLAAVPPFSELDPAMPELFPGTRPPLAAIEVHTPSHRALVENLRRADLEAAALHADFRDLPVEHLVERWPAVEALPPRGLIVVNPPYGERIGGRGHDPELDALYDDLYRWWRSFGPGWRIALLGPGRALKAAFGDRPRLDKPMKNGPLSVSLLVYEPPRSSPAEAGLL